MASPRGDDVPADTTRSQQTDGIPRDDNNTPAITARQEEGNPRNDDNGTSTDPMENGRNNNVTADARIEPTDIYGDAAYYVAPGEIIYCMVERPYYDDEGGAYDPDGDWRRHARDDFNPEPLFTSPASPRPESPPITWQSIMKSDTPSLKVGSIDNDFSNMDINRIATVVMGWDEPAGIAGNAGEEPTVAVPGHSEQPALPSDLVRTALQVQPDVATPAEEPTAPILWGPDVSLSSPEAAGLCLPQSTFVRPDAVLLPSDLTGATDPSAGLDEEPASTNSMGVGLLLPWTTFGRPDTISPSSIPVDTEPSFDQAEPNTTASNSAGRPDLLPSFANPDLLPSFANPDPLHRLEQRHSAPSRRRSRQDAFGQPGPVPSLLNYAATPSAATSPAPTRPRLDESASARQDPVPPLSNSAITRRRSHQVAFGQPDLVRFPFAAGPAATRPRLHEPVTSTNITTTNYQLVPFGQLDAGPLSSSDAVGPPLQSNPGASSSGPSGTKEPEFQWAFPGQLVHCRTCYVFGQVIEKNETHNMLLSVHGGVGNFEHIIFDVQNLNTEMVEQYIMDIRGQSLIWLSRFLLRFGIVIRPDGFVASQNSLRAMLATTVHRMQPPTTTEERPSTVQVNASEDNGALNLGDIARAANARVIPAASYVAPADNAQNFTPPAPGIIRNYVPQPQIIQNYVPPPIFLQNTPQPRIIQNNLRPPPPPPPPLFHTGQVDAPGPRPKGPRAGRPNVGIQRERTHGMKLEHMIPLFHLPAQEATRRLKICPTAFKCVCRKLNLRRWPYRKIRSLHTKIVNLRKELQTRIKYGDTVAVQHLEEEIASLLAQKAEIYENPTLPPPRPGEEQKPEEDEEDGSASEN